MTTRKNRVWRLASRPQGVPQEGDLSWHEEPVGDLADGQVLVRNLYLSIDPTNRIWMSDMPQYMPPVAIGEVMRGGTLGIVEESKHPDVAPGSLVSGMGGWQMYTKAAAAEMQVLPQSPQIPLDAYMAVLNHIGATAFFGLLDIGQPKAGETILVSAAAGAVGSLVGQIGKIHECRVVGIAGTDDKCRWITEELGFDAAINYRTEDVGQKLDEHCPNGIDVYFDNVGGATLDAALARANNHGRIVECGLISMYNATEAVPGPYNYSAILMKRLRVQGIIILDYAHRFGEAIPKLAQWLATGQLKYRIFTVDGLENAPKALVQLLKGANTGKMAVKISEP